jgi:plastocyanin
VRFSSPSKLAVLMGLACALLVGCAPAQRAQQPDVVKTAQVDLPPSYVFAPAHIQVSPGTTVTWTNHDNFSHSVQVQGQSDVHMMKPGETAHITFATPGEFVYLCTLHAQNMRGRISVG